MKRIVLKVFVFAAVSLSLLSSNAVKAQERRVESDSLCVEVLFSKDYSILDPSYKGNGDRLASFAGALAELRANPDVTFDSIAIEGLCSPEGNRKMNQILSLHRAQALQRYLSDQLHIDAQMTVRGLGIDESIINKTNLWPDARKASAVVSCIVRIAAPEAVPAPAEATPCVNNEDLNEGPVANPATDPAGVMSVVSFATDRTSVRYPFAALRSNLLLPLMNGGVEIPLGNRVSVSADCYFPWFWRNDLHKNCFEFNALSFDARYWFGKKHSAGVDNRANRLLGHSVGLFAASGYYDFERNWKGFQGEYWSAGVDYLYAAPIFRGRMHMEFSLGLGYIHADSIPYSVNEDYGKGYHDGKVQTNNIWGPTRATISLVIPLSRRAAI